MEQIIIEHFCMECESITNEEMEVDQEKLASIKRQFGSSVYCSTTKTTMFHDNEYICGKCSQELYDEACDRG